MLDRWNAHDIEGYLEVYRKSSDSEQFIGWQQYRRNMVPPNILEPREMSGSITVNLDDLAPNSGSHVR
jgi:hypothetical protein